MKNNFLKLIIAIALPLAVGFAGSLFTAPEISGWYSGLEKPALSPPNWVFAPVWTILYVLMGFALYLVWAGKDNKKAIAVFFLQLFLNFTWSIVFFGMQSPAFAFLNIVLLLFAILWTMNLFLKISKVAFYLLLPYILWVSFAMYLNYLIWILN